MRNERLFKLVNYLLVHGKTRAYDLAQELDVSVRTIYRDVDTLTLSNIPITCIKGKHGGILIDENYTLDKSYMSVTEQKRLLDSLYGFNRMTDDNNDLLLKVASIFNRDYQKWLDIDFSRWGSRDDGMKFSSIKASILEARVLKFNYINSNSEISIKKVHPIQLAYQSRDWYLKAHCLKNNEIRTYRVSRMFNIVSTDCHFEHDYSLERKDVKEDDKSNLIAVSIYVDKSIVYRLYDEFDSSIVKSTENGHYFVEVEIPEDQWLYGFLISLGVGLKDVTPLRINNKYKEYLKSILSNIS